MATSRSCEREATCLVTLNQVTGYLAMWAVRQSPYPCPDNLELVLREFQKVATPQFPDGVASLPMLKTTFRALALLLKECLEPIPAFVAWNKRKNGDQRPYGFCSATSRPAPDDDFIDLDALYRNVALSCIRHSEGGE